MSEENFIPTSTVAIIKEINAQLDSLLKFAFDDYVALSNSLGIFHKKIKEFYKESGAFIDKNKIERLLEALNQIIIDLQFHDIIRQKIEHTKEIHETLIKDLQTAVDLDHINATCTLSIAQIHFIDDEYQSHSKSIKNVLQNGVGLEISALENFVFDFSKAFNHTVSFAHTIALIVKKLETITAKTTSMVRIKTTKKVLQIKEHYTMRSERTVFNKIFNIEEELENEADDIELF